MNTFGTNIGQTSNMADIFIYTNGEAIHTFFSHLL